MIKPTLFVDVDSTIHDLTPSLLRATEDVTGDRLYEYQVNGWDFLHNRYGWEKAEEIFARALDPAKVMERKPYPGCIRFLRLLESMGVSLVFATHNHDPEAMRGPLTRWLEFHMGSRATVLITTPEHSKVESLLSDFSCPLGIIDDKPDTIRDAVNAGLLTVTIEQPWNLSTILSCGPHVVHFADWDELRMLTHPFWDAMNARISRMLEEGVYA